MSQAMGTFLEQQNFLMGMVYIYIIQYGTPWPHVPIEHLRYV